MVWAHIVSGVATSLEDMEVKMSQWLAGVIWPFSLIWRTLVERVKKAIEVATCSHVLWSYMEISMVNVMRYLPSGGTENCSWVKIWLEKTSLKKGHRVPPSQALRHSKLMRPDKHF